MTALLSASTAKADVTVDDCSLQPDGMIWIPGGTFRVGSDRHYPEEGPAHRVTVDGFWMDRYPVTNRQLKEFVRATKRITVAEIVPDPKDYPGMLPHMIYAGSLMFSRPEHPVSRRQRPSYAQHHSGPVPLHPPRKEQICKEKQFSDLSL